MLKALHRLTGCKWKLEQPVSSSDQLSHPSLQSLPAKISRGSIHDGYFYRIMFGGDYCKLIILEVKTDKTLRKNSIAQCIGYFLASQLDNRETVTVALIITQTKAILIFFPYRQGKVIYSNAIVTEEINIEDDKIYCFLIAFLTKYVLYTESAIYALSTSANVLHRKDTFVTVIMKNEEESRRYAKVMDYIMQKKEKEIQALKQAYQAKDNEIQAKDNEIQANQDKLRRLADQLKMSLSQLETLARHP